MKKNVVRVLALVLVALMCLSLIPFAAHAEEHVHQFEPTTVPATCQYNGYVQMICPICGAGGEIVSYLNELAPHSFVCVEDEKYVIEAGDCEHATQYWKSCSVCEVSAEEEYGEQVRKMQEELVGRMATREITLAEAESIAADRVRVFDELYKFSAGGTGHHYIQVEHQEAACTSDGWKDYSYCDNCGEYFGYEAIPAKGHRWNEFTVTKAATCTEDGSRERVCDVCGEKEVEVLPALGHQGEFTVTKAATCTQDGSMERTCTVCGEKEVVVIPAAHTWGAFTVTEEPGCYASGAQEHTCTVCGVTELEYIPAAHKYVDGVCSVCGEAAPEGYVAAAVESFQGEEEKTEQPAPAEETKSETEEPAEEAKTEGENLSGDDTATFEVNGIIVRFYGNGSTSGSMEDNPLTVPPSDESGVYLTPNTYERTEYAFTGWNTQPDGSGKSFEDKQYVSANDFTTYDEDEIPLYAQWVRIKISFNPNGGSGSMGEQNVTVNAQPLTANTFSRSGYTFAGWDTDSGGHGEHFYDQQKVATEPQSDGTEATIISAPTTLYAQWKKNITVTYQSNVNDGSGKSSFTEPTKYPGDTLTIKKLDETGIPTKANRKFVEWNTVRDGSGDSYKPGVVMQIQDNPAIVTLYAQWGFDIDFNANLGTGYIEPIRNAIENKEVKIPNNLNEITREGYFFAGWNTLPDGSGKAYGDGAVIPASDMGNPFTLYAQWKSSEITISFDPNGGTGTMSPQSGTIGQALTLNPNTYTRDKFAFAGWNTQADGTGLSYKDGAEIPGEAIQDSFTLYAQWTKQVTISFKPNGATGGVMEDQVGAFNTALPLKKNGFTNDETVYKFAGWNTSADGKGTAYEDEATVPASAMTDDFTLYAQWEKINYTVTYRKNADDATGSMEADSFLKSEDAELTKNTFERDGYEFTGWNTRANGKGTAYADGAKIPANTATADITLYAQWASTRFTVSFDANGGEGSMASQTVNKGEKLTLEKNNGQLTKKDNVFTGWNTKADGTGTAVSDGATVNVNSNIVLYAQWSSSTVYFDGNGATGGSMQPQVLDSEKKNTLNANTFTLTNYTFDHWNDQADGKGKLSLPDQGDYPDLASRVLYAQWRKTAFSINYDKNGGGGIDMTPTTVSKNSSGTVLASTYNAPDSTKMFGEWNTKSDGSGTGYQPGATIESDNVPSDITLYAIWCNKLDIWFYPGEGSGTARSIEEPQGFEVKLPTPASLGFEAQSGMAFAGWKLGDGDKIYRSGQQVVFGDEDKVVDDVVYTTARTVTAIWAKEITITYDPNGASTTGRKLQRAAKDADTRLAPISQIGYTRTGYAFTGWGRLSGSDPEKPDYTDNQLVAGGFPNDTTLYALWLKHAFTGKVNVTGTLSFGSETAYVGEILTANVTGEDYFNNFSYQWYRDGYDEGYQIPGETGITYEPVAEDFGHVLFCVVTAKEADEGENTAISNLKVVGIDESDKRIVNNGQTESDYIYGLLPDMFYSINNGPKYLVELDDLGLFEVKQQGVYRFYTADDLQVGSVNVVNWWTIGFGVSTGSGDNAGSGTATMRRGSTTLTASTTITSDGVAILQPYSGVEGYSSVWIVRQDANITDLSLNVRPASSSYGHVSLNSGSYTSSSAERTFYLGTLSGPMMYTVVFNKSSSSPKTADMSNLGLWSTLCFVSLAGTVTILGSARKRRKEGK